MPCDRCGASVERGREALHTCDDERAHAFELFPLLPELGLFEPQLSAWLASPQGRFERFYAERTRRG
jgi:hypothetical protein